MNNFDQEMLEKVDGEIRRLQGIRTMLIGGASGLSVPTRRVSAAQVKRRGTRTTTGRNMPRTARNPMSAADRKKRSEAQRARWARVRQAGSTPAPQSVQESDSHKTTSIDAGTPNKAVS